MTTRTRPPPGIFARETRDTSDEYAEHRIKNTDNPEYLTAMIEVEAARDDPRQERIAQMNQRLAEVRDR
jgi:hypothetical protein